MDKEFKHKTALIVGGSSGMGKETANNYYNKVQNDFCFASLNLIDKLINVEIGTYAKWTKHSDHKPLIVNFAV